MIVRALGLATGLALLPLIAAAQTACPTSPADLDRGVRIGFSGSFELAAQRNAQGQIVEHETYTDGGGFLMVSRDGLIAHYSADTMNNVVDQATIERWEYQADTATLPRPQPGTTFSLQRTAITPDGTRWPEDIQVRVDQVETVSIGGCALSSMRVNMTFTSAGSVYYETYQYLEDLDFAIYLGGASLPSDIDLAVPVTIFVGDVGPMPGEIAAPGQPTPPAPTTGK